MTSDSKSDFTIYIRATPVNQAEVVGVYAPVVQMPTIHIEISKEVDLIYFHDLLDRKGMLRKRRSYEAEINPEIDRILRAKDYFLSTSSIVIGVIRSITDLQMASGMIRSVIENRSVIGLVIMHESLSHFSTASFWRRESNETEKEVFTKAFDDKRILFRTFAEDDDITKFHIHIA
jgi:hypothetical protein